MQFHQEQVVPAVPPSVDSLSVEARQLIVLLAGSVALMMTGFGMIMPIFARRIDTLGGGVADLGYMTLAFGVGQVICATPFGALADRIGRKPVILIALASVVALNGAYLFADSIPHLTGLRLLHGMLTAGLVPAALGIVADTVPMHQRARWIGVVMGSYEAGFIVGPALGGVLYAQWGLAAPFLVSAGLALLAFGCASIVVPHTRPTRGPLAEPRPRSRAHGGFVATLPRPRTIFATLLALDFLLAFPFALIEPQLVFHMYQRLGLRVTDFGLVVGSYGVASVLGQWGLGSVSDQWGRRGPMVLGFLLNTVFMVTLCVATTFWPLVCTAALAGMGIALVTPALSAAYLDRTDATDRGRIMGLKEMMAALGFITGPLVAALISAHVSATQTFSVAAGITLGGAVVAWHLHQENRSVRER